MMTKKRNLGGNRLNHNQPKNQPKKHRFNYHNKAAHNKRRLANLNKKIMTTNRRTKQKKSAFIQNLKKTRNLN